MKRILLAAILIFTASMASAQAPNRDYPTRPIRLVVPFAVGGPLDIAARIVGDSLTRVLGETVVIENRAGAFIGTDYVAKARPDGYTMLMHTGAFSGTIALYKKLPYDGVNDFAPITQISRSSGLFAVVNPALPVHSIQDLVALARKQQVNYGSSGQGTITQFVAELLNVDAGIKMVHIPYKGSQPALNDVLGRQIEITFAGPSLVQPYIRDNRLRPLALSGPERDPAFPDVPTFKELGYPGVMMTAWYGLWFPAKTSPEIVNKVYAAIQTAMPELKSRFGELGIITVGSPPDAFAKFVKDDIAVQSDIMKQAGIPQL